MSDKKKNTAGAEDGNIIRYATIENLETLDYFTKEAYNSLRTNLRFSGADIVSVFVTSCQPNEGKSSISFELARSLAEDGKRVILVDMDLRKSVMVGKRQITTADKKELKGVSHYLSGQAELPHVIYKTNVKNLEIIFSGPMSPNPTELIGGTRFEKMMKYLRETYDAVIVDTPPLGTVVDAALVAPHCDGAILLVQSNTVSYRFAQSVVRQIEASGCRMLGVVLNKAETGRPGYYKGYGYGYYKRGYYRGYYSNTKDSGEKQE